MASTPRGPPLDDQCDDNKKVRGVNDLKNSAVRRVAAAAAPLRQLRSARASQQVSAHSSDILVEHDDTTSTTVLLIFASSVAPECDESVKSQVCAKVPRSQDRTHSRQEGHTQLATRTTTLLDVLHLQHPAAAAVVNPSHLGKESWVLRAADPPDPRPIGLNRRLKTVIGSSRGKQSGMATSSSGDSYSVLLLLLSSLLSLVYGELVDIKPFYNLIIEHHNDLRRNVVPSASDMRTMVSHLAPFCSGTDGYAAFEGEIVKYVRTQMAGLRVDVQTELKEKQNIIVRRTCPGL
ncbi:hypothetical protein C0Q70_06129 [Pomacea canaliculata]|uniref:Uncharacterized protein n=1 Tax=Pomacea canaliculata TaxID=400727 RepID=A0A2T7PN56_POMCA|nr:hypothetical protein C0Q70_06129 [Pomacea canaliculata]